MGNRKTHHGGTEGTEENAEKSTEERLGVAAIAEGFSPCNPCDLRVSVVNESATLVDPLQGNHVS